MKKILFLNNSSDDVKIIISQLKKNGINFRELVTDNRQEYIEALNLFKPDLIISDYFLNEINALEALELKKVKSPDASFIVVTESINEETAVEIMKAGADDYIIKENLGRISISVSEIFNEKTRLKKKVETEKAVEELNRDRILLRKLIDNLPDLINIKDSEGKYILNNFAHMKFIGVDDPETVKGKTPYDFFPEEEASKYINDDRQVLDTGFPIINKEESALQKDTGRRHWYLTSKIPITDDKGNLTYLLTVSHDITQIKKAQEIIAQEKMLLRTLIDNIPDIIFIKDREGRRIMSNRAEIEYTGFKSELELLGKTDIDLFPDETGRRGYNDDMEVINKGVRIINREEDLRDSNGKKIWVITTKVPLYSNEGYITGLVGISRDITKLKETTIELEKAKQKAEESNRFKTAFLSNITHEIRTPMNSIVGFTSLLDDKSLDDETRNSYISVIKQSSTQLLNIVNDIIEISNLEAGIIKLSLQDVNINKMLENLFVQFRDKADQQKLEFVLKPGFKDTELIVNTDPTKFLQVMTNLLSNAFKYTTKGKIEFGYIVEKEQLKFFVSDTGPGILPEHREKIFDRFFRIEHSSNQKREGTGLGLAISKGYVELLGGRIWCESVHGKGSTFFFTIPHHQIFAGKEKKHYDKLDTTACKTILIAEDDYNNYLFINILLTKNGFNTIHAINGKEAVEIIKSGVKVDLIIMDIKMPEMDGYEATQIIKKLNPDLPIISLTAYALPEDREKSLDAGCVDYLTKPVSLESLINIVKKYI